MTIADATLLNNAATSKRRHLRWLPALLLLSLPSCYTSQLWDMDSSGPPTLRQERLLEGHIPVQITEGHTPYILMQTCSPETSDAVAGDVRDVRITGNRFGREAAALLQLPGLFEVHEAKLTGAARTIDGRGVGSPAQMVITGKLIASGWRRSVPTSEIPEAVQQRLATSKPPSTKGWPLALRESGDRLLGANGALLFPEAGREAKITNFVLVDQDGTVMPEEGGPKHNAVLFNYLWQQGWTKGTTFYATLTDGDQQRTLQINTAAFLLVSGLKQNGEVITHESSWTITPVDERRLAAPAKTNPATLHANVNVRTMDGYQPSIATRIFQVALTPVALVGDLVIGVPTFLVVIFFVDLGPMH